jgi:ABC-type transporter Mla MlaB component
VAIRVPAQIGNSYDERHPGTRVPAMSFCLACRLQCVDCDVSHVHCADLATVGALARAHLHARRLGTRLRVVDASPDLRDLIVFAGLDAVLLGPQGEPEQREEAFGVEKRVEADDPSV